MSETAVAEADDKTDAHDEHDDHGHGPGHVLPMSLLIKVFVGLLILTYVTVQQSFFELGETEFVATMLIATIKASLVALFFMHLKYDKGLNGMLLAFSLVFVGLFLAMTLVDVAYYMPDINGYDVDQPVGLENRS